MYLKSFLQAIDMSLEAKPLYNGTQRVYKDFASGTWLEKTQVSICIRQNWCTLPLLSQSCMQAIASCIEPCFFAGCSPEWHA